MRNSTGLVVLVVAAAVVALWLVVSYNRFVRLRSRSESSWAQIDVQLQRRYDLVPNLVETVKGYSSHERDTLAEVTRARAEAIAARGPAQQAEAENLLTQALRSLFAVSESYPDLKASENFLQLQEELSRTESRIAYSRQFYNDVVQKLNTRIQSFPSSLVARLFGFREREYFEADAASLRPSSVRF